MSERNPATVSAEVTLSVHIAPHVVNVVASLPDDEAVGVARRAVGDGGPAEALAEAVAKAVHALRVNLGLEKCATCQGHGALVVPHPWGPEFETDEPCHCDEGYHERREPHPFSYAAERARLRRVA